MIKKILFSLFILCAQATALPIGNPWEASLFYEGVFCESDCFNPCDAGFSCSSINFRIGFYGDYVFDRKMQVDQIETHSTIHETELYTNAALLVLNVSNRVDLYTALGATNLSLATFQEAFAAPVSASNLLLNVDAATAFSYTLGARVTVWECGCFAVGADAKYFYTKSDVKYIINTDTGPARFPDFRAKYEEWQIAVGATYRINIAPSVAVLPYLAVKWDHVGINMGNFRPPDSTTARLRELRFFNLENSNDFGFGFGLTLVGCDKWDLTAEWRFSNERAFHVNTQFRF